MPTAAPRRARVAVRATLLVAGVLAGCTDPAGPDFLATGFRVLSGGPLPIGYQLAEPTLSVRRGAIIVHGEDTFGASGYLMSAESVRQSRGDSVPAIVLAVESKLPGFGLATIWYYKYEATITPVAPGTYELQLVRMRDRGPSGHIEFRQQVTVP